MNVRPVHTHYVEIIRSSLSRLLLVLRCLDAVQLRDELLYVGGRIVGWVRCADIDVRVKMQKVQRRKEVVEYHFMIPVCKPCYVFSFR